jgi:hypothetical protein
VGKTIINHSFGNGLSTYKWWFGVLKDDGGLRYSYLGGFLKCGSPQPCNDFGIAQQNPPPWVIRRPIRDIYIYIFYVCWLSPFCCCCWWWWWNSAMCWQNVIFCWWLMVETYHTCNQNWISTDRMKFTYLRGQLCYWFSPCLLMNLFIWLMISNMAFSFHFIYGLILPIDELMIFKMVKPC